MNKKINIGLLLQNVHPETILYSPICGNVKFNRVSFDQFDPFIEVMTVSKPSFNLQFQLDGTKYGTGEVMLFPSKEMRDWNCFNAYFAVGTKTSTKEDLDNLVRMFVDKGAKEVSILPSKTEDTIYYLGRITGVVQTVYSQSEWGKYLLAYGRQLKYSGKPKIGDVIVTEDNSCYMIDVSATDHDKKETRGLVASVGSEYYNNSRLATPEEIDCWNTCHLKERHLHYSKSKRALIHWFLPFEQVIVRNHGGEWSIDIFKKFESNYKCMMHDWDECLPHNSNTELLIGTSDSYINN